MHRDLWWRFLWLSLLMVASGCSGTQSASEADAGVADGISTEDVGNGEDGSAGLDLPTAPQPVATAQEALEIVLEQVLGTDAQPHPVAVYGLPEPLEPGVVPSDLELLSDPLPEQAYWFFWIDDEPDARFAHASRFVYVGVDDGVPLVGRHAYWPVIDGVPVFDEGGTGGEAFLVYDSGSRSEEMAQQFAPLDPGPVAPDAPYTPYSWEQSPCPPGQKPR